MTKATKAEIMAELVYRKRQNPLSFVELLPQQQKFYDDPAKIKCAWGGNRSGKSHLGAYYVLKKGLERKLSIWIDGTTFKDSINIQQRKLKELVPLKQVKYGRWSDENGFTNRLLSLKNNTRYNFKSYDQGRESHQGEAVDIIWHDEEGPKDIFTECKMRLIDTNGQMIMTMTSLKGMTPLLDDLYEGADIIETRYAEYLDEYVPTIAEKNGVRFYFLWTTDNPHIDQVRLRKDINKMDRSEIKSRIYGLPINLAGRIYPQFNKRIHLVRWDDVPSCQMSVFTVLDPHDRKPWAIQWWAVHPTGTCFCVDEYPDKPFHEIHTDDKTYDEYAKIIKDKERKLCNMFRQPRVTGRLIDPNFGNKTMKLAIRQHGDSSTTPKRELIKRGLTFRDANDGIREGHLAVKQALDWTVNGDELVKQPKIFIVDYCINTIEHLIKYAYRNPNTTDGDIKDNVGLIEKYKDFSDCTRYFITSNPTYRDHHREKREAIRRENEKGKAY